MKFALVIDTISNIDSYYVKESQAYNFSNNEPYSHENSIGSTCYMNTWNYPWLFDGYFINWQQHKDQLPNLELDVIFVTIERYLNKYDWCNIDKLRKFV